MRAKTLIQSVDRAIDILEIVRDAEGPIRAAMIAHMMNLPLKTAHNLIRSLLLHGYLVQNEEKSYQLGPECFLLADQAKGPFHNLGRAAGRPILELQQETGASAFFGCEYACHLYCVTIVDASGYWEVNGHQPWLNALHATAVGRVILAEKGEDYIREFLRQGPLKKFTSLTKDSPEELLAEIDRVRRNGYCIVEDEHVIGFTSIAIPVHNLRGKLLGGICSSYRSDLWHTKRIQLEDTIRLLRHTAGKIAEASSNYA